MLATLTLGIYAIDYWDTQADAGATFTYWKGSATATYQVSSTGYLFVTHREVYPFYDNDFIYIGTRNSEIFYYWQGQANIVNFSDAWQKTSNLVQSISSTSETYQYPSAKAVYDYVDTMITQAIGGSY